VHPADVERLQGPLLAVLRGEAAYRAEHRVRTPDGRWIWIESAGEIVQRDADGRALRAIGTNRPITARKLAEQALRTSEEKFAKAFRSSSAMITIATLEDGRYIDVNDAYER